MLRLILPLSFHYLGFKLQLRDKKLHIRNVNKQNNLNKTLFDVDMRYLQRIREFLNQAFTRLEAGFSIKTSSTKTATALSFHEATPTVTNDNTPSTNATITLSGFETPLNNNNNAPGHGGSSNKSNAVGHHCYGGDVLSPVLFPITPVVKPSPGDVTNSLQNRETSTDEQGTSYPN